MQRTSMGARRLHPDRRAHRWGVALLGLVIPAGACGSVNDNHEASAGASGSGGAAEASASSASVGGGGASATASQGSGVVGPCAAAPWARDLGPGSSVSELHQALGADCTTILTGYFKGALDLGNGPLSANADAKGFFVAKLDAAGHTLWSHAFAATVEVGSPAVVVNALGSIVLAGNFTGTLDLGAGPLASGNASNVFVARLDSDGHSLWSQRYSCGGDVGDLAVDGAGNVVVGGTFGGDMDFGLGVIHAGAATHGFLVKLDSTGAPLWQKDIASPDEATVYGLALDGTGAISFTGEFKTSIFDFTTTAFRSSYVARYDAGGTLLWAHQIGGKNGQMARDVAVDAIGNSVVGGMFSAPLDIGDPTVDLGFNQNNAMGGPLACAIRYDGKGKVTWGRCFYIAPNIYALPDQRVNGVAFGPAGEIWMTGQFRRIITFGGDPLLNPSNTPRIFVAELDAAGKQLGAAAYGATQGEAESYGASIAVDAAGRAHVVGTLTGSGTFDGGPLKSSGDQDVFVATVDF